MSFTKLRSKPRVLYVAIGTALLTGLIVLLAGGLISANEHGLAWPTPPPGPNPQIPRITNSNDIDLVNPPSVLGATVWIIDPIAALLPRFPPIFTTDLRTTDGLQIVVSAGSTDDTVQVVYEPIPLDEAPQPGPQQDLRRVFDLRAFDDRGNGIDLDLRRSWLLKITAQGLIQNVESPSRLIIARYNDGSGWIPEVTTYHRNSGLLEIRILEPGLFGVIMESSIISGQLRTHDLRTASSGLAGK